MSRLALLAALAAGCASAGSPADDDDVPIDAGAIDAAVDASTDARPAVVLTVVLAGSGTGAVTSSPIGIACGADCTESYAPGTAVVLTAAPSGGSTFLGWSGAGCTGIGTCTITIGAPVTVAATFASSAIQRIGHTTPLGQSSNHAADDLLGEQLVVPGNFTLRQFGVLVITGGPQVKLALYTDVAGAPGSLIAQTAATTLVAGTMEIDPTVGNVVVPAGTYWIMGVYSANASIGYTTNATTNVVKYRALPFASALPSPFGATTMYTGQSFNYYLVVQ